MADQENTRADGMRDGKSLKLRVGDFVRRRSRVLSLVAGLIVFCTFVVKDGLREQLKELEDTIDHAQSAARQHDDNQKMMGLIENIYQRVRYPRNQQRDVDLIASSDPYQVYLVVFRVHRQTRDAADSIRHLVEILPHQAERDRTLATLDDRWKDLDESMMKFEDSMVRPAWNQSRAAPSVPKDQIQALRGLEHEISTLSHAVGKLVKEVTEDAARAQTNVGWWYKACTMAGYFLYPLGWAIGLVSSWFGAAVKAVGD